MKVSVSGALDVCGRGHAVDDDMQKKERLAYRTLQSSQPGGGQNQALFLFESTSSVLNCTSYTTHSQWTAESADNTVAEGRHDISTTATRVKRIVHCKGLL